MQPDAQARYDADKDSLHILPLSMLPLVTKELRKARLIKNARMEGMVELFSGEATGSGQISPHDLALVFHFDESNAKDLEIVKQVSELPSYDIYSLRIELRKLDIKVDDYESLRLSDEQTRQLNDYMQAFIEPLISSVFGAEAAQTDDFRSLIELLQSPDQQVARDNLMKLSQALGVEYTVIPKFLQDYGDVYLSLAYYQYCLDRIKPGLQNFFESLEMIQNNQYLRSNVTLMDICKKVAEKIQTVFAEVDSILDIFRAITDDMWVDISGERFRAVANTIHEYQTKIGGALCALTIKTNAWETRFPEQVIENLAKRADFIMSEMRQGIEKIEPISYKDAARASARALLVSSRPRDPLPLPLQ